MRKTAVTLALAGFIYAATGLALAVHLHHCHHHAGHHDPQNCAHFYTIHAGAGAELPAPVPPPELLDGPSVVRAIDAQRLTIESSPDSVSPRGPPLI